MTIGLKAKLNREINHYPGNIDLYNFEAPNSDNPQAAELSYVERVAPIRRVYDSLLRRVMAPRENELFDNEVRDVIGSMNNVGRAYVDPAEFTTRTRRMINKRENLCSLIAGGIFAAAIIYFKSKGYVIENSGVLNYAGAVLAGLTLPALIIKSTGNSVMYNRLKDLGKAAEKTDEFLKSR